MRVTIADIKSMKAGKQRIPMLTAYDYTTAKVVDEAGMPLILVGDSLGMVMLGYESTVSVTMDDMLHHVKAVVRGSKRSLVIADMPFMSYHATIPEALHNAARFIQEAGAQAVKLEGGERMAETIRRIVECGIPVMGHIGLTPQSFLQLGGYKVQGKTPASAWQLVRDALAVEKAGAFAVVLETVPAGLGKMITERLSIPTIGIGAGPDCDGQVQVVHDLLGLFTDFVPKHAKQYAKLADAIHSAVTGYMKEVTDGVFPTSQHSSMIDQAVLADIERQLADEYRE